MKFTNRMFAASAVLLFAFVLNAFGSSSLFATATIDGRPIVIDFGRVSQAQFDRMLAAAPAFKTVSSATTTLQGQMSRIGLFGHVQTQQAALVQNGLVQNGAAVAAAISFGPCPDMGIMIGSSQGQNPMLDQVDSYQTCTNYEYTVGVNHGDLQPLPVMEWTDATCGADGGQFYATQSVTTQLAENGTVFSIPSLSGAFAITAGSQLVSVPVLSTSDTFGDCTPTPITDQVYAVVANDTNVTGVPNASIPVPFSRGAP